MERLRRAFGLGVIVVSFSTFLAQVYRLHLERWDDAYITFRFARHLASGLGLVWNVGGERVEGFTSLLHVLVIALGFKLGIDPWLWSLLLSVGCVIASCFVMLAIVSRHAGGIDAFAAIVVGIFVADPLTAIHSTSGLETQLFVLLLNLAALAALEFFDKPDLARSLFLALVVIAACLTRPEAILYGLGIYAALGLSFILARRRKEGQLKNLQNLGLSLLVVVLGGSLYVLWKYSYFGYLLPNPYYVKSAKFSLSGLPEVSEYIVHLSRWYLPLLLPVLFAYLFARRRRRRDRSEDPGASESFAGTETGTYAKVLIVLLPAAMGLAYYTTIIHEVGGGSRFSYPTYSLILLGVLVALSPILRRIQAGGGVRFGMVAMSFGWFVILFVSCHPWMIGPRPIGAFGQFHTKVGDALKATGLDSKGTIICDAAGVIPYVSGFDQIDRVGLTDNFLSGRSDPTPSEREAYLWSRSADVYIGAEPPATPGATDSESDPRMSSQYVSRILLKRPLRLIESRIYLQDPQLLFRRMRVLRDDWELVGELDWPGWEAWRLKSFVYVNRSSPYREIIREKIKPLVESGPDQLDLEDVDQNN